MSTAITVAYADAEILARANRDILVFHPATGRCWRFDEPIWPTHPKPTPADQIVENFGTSGMDDEFDFVWLQPEPE
jgi:hypothetical protein